MFVLWCNHSQVEVGDEPIGFWECMTFAMATDVWVTVALVYVSGFGGNPDTNTQY